MLFVTLHREIDGFSALSHLHKLPVGLGIWKLICVLVIQDRLHAQPDIVFLNWPKRFLTDQKTVLNTSYSGFLYAGVDDVNIAASIPPRFRALITIPRCCISPADQQS